MNINKFNLNREDVYNDVIQYTIQYFPKEISSTDIMMYKI